jgi:hypothetical protein
LCLNWFETQAGKFDVKQKILWICANVRVTSLSDPQSRLLFNKVEDRAG